MKKLLALFISLVMVLALATPASAHPGCVRFQPKPSDSRTKVVSVLAWTCGKVYDGTLTQHSPQFRHSSNMEVRFWVEARPVAGIKVIKGKTRDAKMNQLPKTWVRIGRVERANGAAGIHLGMTRQKKPGLWEYRTRAETYFNGPLGIQKLPTKTNSRIMRR